MKIDIIQIKHRYNSSVLFECEAESLKIAVELAVSKKIDLSDSNLRGSDLSDSDLRYSNLSYSDLRDSNLSYSNLSGSDLSDSIGIVSFTFKKHLAVSFFNKEILTTKIGCEQLPTIEFLAKHKDIGIKNGYSEEEINAYGAFIKLCLENMESRNEHRIKKDILA